MLYVPIHSGTAVIGILSIQSYTPHAYQQEDLETLQAMAHYCGEALERINLASLAAEHERVRIGRGKDNELVFPSPIVLRIWWRSPWPARLSS